MVQSASTPRKRFISLTDEVPRSSSHGSIIRVYKATPKGPGYAPAVGRATLQPCPQGGLQRQSRPSLREGRKAKPQSVGTTPASSWNKLASANKRSRRRAGSGSQAHLGGRMFGPIGTASRFSGSKLCPSVEPPAPASDRGRSVREIRSPVQYEELTSLRQRGGGGLGLPPTHWAAVVLARGAAPRRCRSCPALDSACRGGD